MTRRSTIIALLAPGAAFAADAWKKKFADWKKEDALAILNRSPWAQVGKVEFKIDNEEIVGPRSGGVIGPMEGPPGGNGTLGPPGGAPARAGGGIIQHGPEAMPNFKVLVRWESAKPVRLAMGMEGDRPKANTYVVSVVGFPILRPDLAATLAPMQRATRLERNGHHVLRAERVETRESVDGTVLMFRFDAGDQPITLDEREVVFVTRVGAMHLRVKFTLRDMMFERTLAV